MTNVDYSQRAFFVKDPGASPLEVMLPGSLLFESRGHPTPLSPYWAHERKHETEIPNLFCHGVVVIPTQPKKEERMKGL